ncbi:MAG: sugar phosphate isomerase/epimerase, partial [Anaerolineaceae bacterium]
SVATGSFWPEKTLPSINLMARIGMADCELNLQADEFRQHFDRSFDIPILMNLMDRVESGHLVVHSVHAPNMDTGNGYSLRSRLDYLVQTIDVAASLEAQVIDLHPHHLFSTHEAAQAYLRGETRLTDALLPGFTELLDQAQETGLILALENIKMWEDDEQDFFNHPVNLRRLSDELDHAAFGITLDVVHAQCCGWLYAMFSELSDRIVNLHLADYEPPMERLPLGEGSIEWGEVIPLIDRLYRLRCITVELTRASTQDVSRSVRFLQDRLQDYQ